MKKLTRTIFAVLLNTSLLLMLVSCSKGDFYLLGNKEITLEVHTAYVEPGYHIKGDVPVSLSGLPDTDVLGTYTITYTATLNGKDKVLTRTVTVVDTTAPEITLVGHAQNIKCTNKVYEEEGFSALDNLDGDVTGKVTVTPVADGFLYRVKDNAGNLAEITRSFTLKDTEFPVLSLYGSETVVVPLGGVYTEIGATAIDNCDDMSSLVTISGNVNTNVLGLYTITYSAIDLSGNASVKTRSVEVKDIPLTTVYLTFDDGPSLRTLEVLDILKKYNVKATFFVGKKADSLKYILIRAHNEGHTVALHAYSHTASIIYSSTTTFFTNLYNIQDWVESATGEKSYIYRFPGGSSNLSSSFNPGIMTTLTKMVLEAGFHYFDWNVSSGDGNALTTTEQMIHNVTTHIKVGGSYVVLMHDSASHDESVAAVAPILDYLQSIGAQILPITMDTPQVHHHVAN